MIKHMSALSSIIQLSLSPSFDSYTLLCTHSMRDHAPALSSYCEASALTLLRNCCMRAAVHEFVPGDQGALHAATPVQCVSRNTAGDLQGSCLHCIPGKFALSRVQAFSQRPLRQAHFHVMVTLHSVHPLHIRKAGCIHRQKAVLSSVHPPCPGH